MATPLADQVFGPVVYKGKDFSIRVVEGEDGLHAFAFRLVDGDEQKPLGFILGSNAMHFKRLKDEKGEVQSSVRSA